MDITDKSKIIMKEIGENMSRKVNGTYYTKEQAGYAKKYLKNFDEIRIRVPKGAKEELYREIEKRGYNSMNQFVQEAIYHFLEQ